MSEIVRWAIWLENQPDIICVFYKCNLIINFDVLKKEKIKMGTFEDLAYAGEILNNIYNNLTNKYKITKNFDYDSLEYFSCSIFNSLFGYDLVNLNEVEKMNSSFIDLIDISNKVGVQVTKEEPNTKKLTKSANAFDEYDVDKVIVFFFSTSSAKKIKSTKGEEVWTIQTIEAYLKKNPKKCKTFIESLEIWNDSNGILPSDLVSKINDNTQIQINEMFKKKKIDKSLLVQEKSDQKNSLYFCGPTFSKVAFDLHRGLFLNSFFGKFLSSIDNDDEYSFKNLINVNGYWNINFEDLDKRKNNLINLYHDSKDNKNKKDVFQYSNRASYTVFNEIISSNKAAYSNVLSIVRSAGQGKTVFCCQLANFLIDAGVPCLFIAHLINSGNIYEEFKKQIERIGLNNNYGKNLKIICKYLKVFNKTIIIIVDALNEYADITDAIKCISDIIKDCKSVGVEARIIISSRNKKYEEFEDNLKSISNGIFCLNPKYLDNQIIKEKYFEKYAIRVKRNFFLESLFNQSRLFIKIFCDTYKNKTIDLKKYDIITLFSEYFDERAKMDMRDNVFSDKEEFFDTIKLVTDWMISNGVFDRVPIREFNVTQRRNIKKLADGDIFNIVNNKKVDYISFVFEEYRDYFLLYFFKDKEALQISDYLAGHEASLDGLIRNIVIYRRNNEKYNKEDDLKFKWYFDGSINVFLNLPLQELDEIDKNAIVDKINETVYTDEFGLNSINKMIWFFINPENQNTIFNISFIKKLNKNGIDNFMQYLSNDYLIDRLLHSIYDHFIPNKPYMIALCEFLYNNKIILSYDNRDLPNVLTLEIGFLFSSIRLIFDI